ncbi:MAG: hypothetical protein N2109_02595 [Fimbriimonadales bacterium]|nr:hypothetical protein [Fimbriimonadales bacterium]
MPGNQANSTKVGADGASDKDPVEEAYRERKRARQAHDEHTDRTVAAMEEKLERWYDALLELQRKAGHHAGALGLFYDPEKDALFRTVALEPMAAPHRRWLEESRVQWVEPDGRVFHLSDDDSFEQEAPPEPQPNGERGSDPPERRTAVGAPASGEGADAPKGPARFFLLGHRPTADAPLDGAAVSAVPGWVEEKPYAGKETPYRDWIGWVVAVLAGMFVGYGVGMLSGVLGNALGLEKLYYTLGCMLIGVGLVTGMKAAVGTIWYTLGRRNAKSLSGGSWWSTVSALLITLAMIVAEVALGAAAFQTYLSRRVWTLPGAVAQHEVPWIVLILVALCVTMPLLVMEAYSKYAAGNFSLTLDEKNEAHREAVLEQKRRAWEEQRQRAEEERRRREQDELLRIDREQQEYEERLSEARERAKEDEELRRRLEKDPDFQAFQKYRTEIASVRLRIKKLEKQIVAYKISRGFQRP